jgi:hypothetical protein
MPAPSRQQKKRGQRPADYAERALALRDGGLTLSAACAQLSDESAELGKPVKAESIRQAAIRLEKKRRGRRLEFDEAVEAPDLYGASTGIIGYFEKGRRSSARTARPEWERAAFIDVQSKDGEILNLVVKRRVLNTISKPLSEAQQIQKAEEPYVLAYEWGVWNEQRQNTNSITPPRKSRTECLVALRDWLKRNGFTTITPGMLERSLGGKTQEGACWEVACLMDFKSSDGAAAEIRVEHKVLGDSEKREARVLAWRIVDHALPMNESVPLDGVDEHKSREAAEQSADKWAGKRGMDRVRQKK